MKKIISFASLALVAIIISGCGATTPKPNISQENGLVPNAPVTENAPVANQTDSAVKVLTQAISIQNFIFSPSSVTVIKGAVVTWTNNDSAPHQIKAMGFNSPVLNQGESWSYTFNQVGTVNYSCYIHPSMTGSIKVE